MTCKHLRLPLALAVSLLASTLAHAQASSDSARTPAADPSPSYTTHNVRSEFASIFTF
jgi:Spy/CpxP family protein refolding chaperone